MKILKTIHFDKFNILYILEAKMKIYIVDHPELDKIDLFQHSDAFDIYDTKKEFDYLEPELSKDILYKNALIVISRYLNYGHLSDRDLPRHPESI